VVGGGNFISLRLKENSPPRDSVRGEFRVSFGIGFTEIVITLTYVPRANHAYATFQCELGESSEQYVGERGKESLETR
jgi:hypothetical protein